ncbi:MAG: glycosyltransferase family 2 protein [Kiritimatiellae bacterium]|nr:glycosyltransferase family 2 protein [Kiritimatiellia bacterium]
MPACTVIVPCYNEQESIEKTINLFRTRLSKPDDLEFVFINDGSSDQTGDLLEKMTAGHKNMRVVHHERNGGYGSALKTGIRRSHSEWIAIVDADGTYPIDQLETLIGQAHDVDMVVGARTGDDVTYPLIKKIPKLFITAYASWIAGRKIPDINSGMRVFRREIAEKFFHLFPDGFSFTTTITLAMLTNHYDVRYVPINYATRVGHSKIRPIRDTLNFFKLIFRIGVYFSPMRVFMPIASTTFLVFLLCLAYDVLILNNLTDKTVFLFMFTAMITMFSLLADMIDKRLR